MANPLVERRRDPLSMTGWAPRGWPSSVTPSPVPNGAESPFWASLLTRGAFYNRGMKTLAYTRAAQLPDILAQRIVILDGAMGTMIQRFKLGEAQYRGEGYNGPRMGRATGSRTSRVRREGQQRAAFSITRPDVIRDIHERYLAAGADLIETNTFGATTIAQEDYQMADLAREMNLKSAQLARAACDKYSTPDKPRFVAGALGPTPKTASISPDVNDPGARNVDFEQLRAAYYEQVEALVEGGSDVLLVETIFDTLNAKAALFAIDEFFRKQRRAPAAHHQRHRHRCLGPHPERARRSRPSGTACATRARWP